MTDESLLAFDPIVSPVDYILLSGRRSPGLADIEGAGSPRRWDERRGYGQSGARVVYRGAGLSRFSVVLRIYTSQDWADWDAWKGLVYRELPDVSRLRALATQADQSALANDSAATERTLSQARAAIRSTRPRAMDIWHPILVDLGIGSVVVEDTLQPVQTGDGEWTIAIKMIEFRMPVRSLAAPAGSDAAPVPQTAAQRAILNLTGQNDALAAEL